MYPSQRIAYSALPLIVLAWATLSLLGSTAHIVEGTTSQGDALIGLSLCTVTAAVLLGSRGPRRLLDLHQLRRLRWKRFLARRPGTDFQNHRHQYRHRSSSGLSNAGWIALPEFQQLLLT